MSDFKSLPMETVTDILLRLPVESLVRCMCVCKSWRSLIAEPFFINNQLLINRQGSSNRFLLKSRISFCGELGRLFLASLHCCKTFTKQKQIEVPNIIEGYKSMIIASCNGLLCLLMREKVSRFHSRDLLLWNPSIKKFKILPRPHFPAHSSYDLAHGFAFIPRSNDYKVVRLVHDKVKGCPKIEIYNLSTNSWRTWSGEGVRCAVTHYCRPAFVNGAVHWTANKELETSNPFIRAPNLIVAFHMEDEVFREILLPEDSYVFKLLVVSEKLVYFVGLGPWDLWMLEDYGVSEFWTKLHTIRPPESFSMYPLQSPKKGEILFAGCKKLEFCLFDLERQEFKMVDADGVQLEVIKYLARHECEETKLNWVHFELMNYTESLVLFNEGIHDSSDAMLDFEEEVNVKDTKEKLGEIKIKDAMDFLRGIM